MDKNILELKMALICSILFSIVLGLSNGFSCGPDGKCLCSSNIRMDCSETMFPLYKICEQITFNTSESNVSTVYAENNGISAIANNDLVGCEYLTELNLRGNNISVIETHAFQNVEFLRSLDLGFNNLETYYQSRGDLVKLPATLHELKLNGNVKGNRTDQFEYPSLEYLQNVKALYLDGLPYRSFPRHYLTLPNLENLTLSGLIGNCNISQISNTTFENLNYLKRLNLSSCHIENINAGAFLKLPHLTHLDLSQNMRLGFKAFRNVSYSLQFTNIKFLDVSKVFTTFGFGTQIRRRDICYLWNTTLREVTFSSNRLLKFETNAFLLLPSTLQIVHIEDNKFTFAPYLLQLGCLFNVTNIHANKQNGAHSPLKYLFEPQDHGPEPEKDVDDCPFMEDNFLRNISKIIGKQCHYYNPNKTFHFDLKSISAPQNLKVLDFADCVLQYNLSEVPIAPENNSIESLDFSSNVLSAWTGPIGPFPNLKYVDLSKNYCSWVGQSAFLYLSSVENLQLQQNFLGLVLSSRGESLTLKIFSPLINVKTLNLSSNIITTFPKLLFSKLPQLETLDLSVNNIDSWTADVNGLNNFLHLILRFNFIRNLPGDLTTKLVENSKRLGKPFTLDLRNNTITCSCQEKSFLQWMVKYKDSLVEFDDYIFVDEAGIRISAQTFLQNVENLDKVCRSYTLIIVLATVCISVFLAIVFGGIIYKNRWKIQYLIRQARVRHFGYRNIENQNQDNEYMYDAFISYADDNARFILDKLMPSLENRGIKLCLHDRDFVAGRNVLDNIMEGIGKSKKMVAVMSEDFVKSKWCVYEFNMARMESIYSRQGSNYLIVVMLDDVSARHMSVEMLRWIRYNTYLEYTADEEEEHFWDNLCDSINE